jgi:hypothetical protein
MREAAPAMAERHAKVDVRREPEAEAEAHWDWPTIALKCRKGEGDEGGVLGESRQIRSMRC